MIVLDDPTFRITAPNRSSIPLVPHNCGRVCPSCELPCRIAWEARAPRYNRRAARMYHSDGRGHLW